MRYFSAQVPATTKDDSRMKGSLALDGLRVVLDCANGAASAVGPALLERLGARVSVIGATPDGRLAGEPLAYSLSANQGRDTCGVTAMINSLARLPHNRAAGASAAWP